MSSSSRLPNDPSQQVEFLQREARVSVEELAEAVSAREFRVRFWAARRPELSTELIEQLRSDPNNRVRHSLLVNPVVPLEEPADQLAVAEDVVVRRCLARRPTIEPSTLAILAGDTDIGVRTFVARHPLLGEDLALRLLDDHWSVRLNLATQRGRWPWLDDSLGNDDDECVRAQGVVPAESDGE